MFYNNEYTGKSVLVLGLGVTGLSLCNYFRRSQASIYVWDDNVEHMNNFVLKHQDYKIFDQQASSWQNIECIAISPGIPIQYPSPHPLVTQAKLHNCRVTSDIEIFLTHIPNDRCIGITGTNGKSTTTALIAHMLASSGLRSVAIGNIGKAVLDVDTECDFWVIELSSFQLSMLRNFHIKVGVTLNITPDHILESGGFENYINMKKHLSENCDYAVLGYDNYHTRKILENLNHDKIGFSTSEIILPGIITAHSNSVHLGGEKIFEYTSMINANNVAAASAVCLYLGINPNVIALGLKTFVPLPHRNEYVGTIGEVMFINDSKATNAESTEPALKQYQNDYLIYWLAGGRMKEGGISALSAYFPKIRHVFLFGEAKEAFAQTLGDQCHFTLHQDLEEAFGCAYALAKTQRQKSVILLSPSCASFDQWKNFNERGDFFRSLYNKLKLKIDYQNQIEDIANKFIEMSALYGISDQTLLRACIEVKDESAFCHFPQKCRDILYYINTRFQEKLTVITNDVASHTRIRDKVHFLVMQQLRIYAEHKNYREFLRSILKYALHPNHLWIGLRILLSTVNNIWHLSGDKSTNFSYYTKRASLGVIYLGTLIYFIDDYSSNFVNTESFLRRRISNIMTITKLKNSLKKCLSSTIRS